MTIELFYLWVVIATTASMVTLIQAEEITSPTIRISPILKPPPSSSTTTTTHATKTNRLAVQAPQPLKYLGGPVINNPRAYLVFWGSQWINNDPSNEAAIIISFMNGVGGSAWLNTATQYCSGGAVGSTTCTAGMYLYVFFCYY